MAPNQFSTNSNPLIQGGWAGEGGWPYPPGSPSDGSFSPAPSSNSSSSSGSSSSLGGWYPAQSTFGALPISAVPGASPPNLLGPAMQLRFMTRGNHSELCIVISNRTCYAIRTSMYRTSIMTTSTEIATIIWPSNAPGSASEPVVVRYGRVKRMSEFLTDVPGSNTKLLTVLDRRLYWVVDQSGITVTSNLQTNQALAYVNNYNGVVISVVREGLHAEMLNFIIITTILMQGRHFVGIR